jgi:probable sporulation protein (polysaccharide deacetylase family)
MRGKAAAMAVCMAVVWALAGWNGPVGRYVESVKQDGRAMDAYADRAGNLESGDPLLARIRQEAEKRRIEPVDAVVDRVWKAIPGYNGLEVDIDRSYEAMLGQPADAPLKLFYREVEPEVSLDDLGAHPIYRGNPKKPMAALMINVAWGNEYIGPMLDTLDKEKVKATFFLDGSWLNKNPDLAKQIASRGHEMSNHAYTHPDMAALGRSQQYQQIERTEKLLRATLEVHNRWFAPPSGSYNATTVSTAYELGLKTVLWTVDTVDWKRPPSEQIVSKIAGSVGPGSLVLMHPTASSRDALTGMIAAIRSKGLTLGTVSDTLSEKRVPDDRAAAAE